MTRETAKPRIYLAGPGVFRPDAKEFGRRLKLKCANAGLVGCFPLDNDIDAGAPEEIARAIYRANVELIDASDAIIAEISPFRGPNMDPGTAWEIGYGIARGLPVYVWSADPSLVFARTERYLGPHADVGTGRDQNGWTIENFGLVENLMIAVSVTSLHATEDAAIAACAADLKASA